jgi:hypothetical protein
MWRLLRLSTVTVLLGLAPAPARADDTTAALALLRALPAGELILFEAPRSGRSPRLLLMTRVKTPRDRLQALLTDPQAYRRAIPAFVRADTLAFSAGSQTLTPTRRLAWELEIPLWNLEGELEMRPLPDGVSLDLVAGDLAPGRFRLRALPDGETLRSILIVDGSAPVKDANWITRRLAARDATAEPAMAATAAFVLLRALALLAERPAGPTNAGPRWPRAPMSAAKPEHLDGQALGAALAALGWPLGPRSAAALVRSRADGRLHQVALALQSKLPVAALNARLARAEHWHALAGWKHIDVRPAPDAPGRSHWQVDSSLPFVDFDATWLVQPAPFRAAIAHGDWRGAVMGWDVLPAAPSVAVFSLHPRVETTGYLPRKLIEAEPLLEHGLALGLAYVDAMALLAPIQPEAR